MKNTIFLFLFLPFVLMSCEPAPDESKDTTSAETESQLSETGKAQEIINRAIEQHGGERYADSFVEFDFRDRHYSSRRKNGEFTYERIFTDEEGQKIRDVLNNKGLFREINGQKVSLSPKDSSAYSNSVNSVLYFALLPYFLNDPAVNATYLGEADIKGEPYHEIMVTFSKEGGGKDHEDEFVYWIHQERHTMDYLAYNYLTDGGGARFREAYNTRTVEGIRFADYINYKPEGDSRDVATFDSLFEAGKLEEVSRIDSENVQVKVF